MKQKLSTAFSLAVILMMLITSVALADDISNNLDGTVDATLEVMSLTTGGSNGTAGLFVFQQNGDGKQGCNLTGQTELVVSVASSNTAIATVSPASITFTSCGMTPTLTVTPVSVGSVTIYLSQVSNSTAGTFNLLPASFTVNVSAPVSSDTTPPTLHLPADITAEATGASGAAVTFIATADDTDPLHPTVVCSPVSSSIFVLGTTTVNCSATDTAGNTADGSFSVTVQDTTPPVIAAHAGVTAEATSALGATVSYTAPATSDAVDGAGTATCAPASGTQFALGNTTVNCSATDAAGNPASPTSFTVTVQDTTPPVIAAHADVTAEATSALGAIVSYTSPATSDAVDGAGTATCAPASGTQFALGNTTVNCSATDAAGNPAVPTSFTVTVQDTTPPAITCPASIAGTVGQSVSLGTPTVSDIVDPSPIVTNNAPVGFGPGLTIVTWTATDASGNHASCQQNVTLRYFWLGFFQPIDMGILNVAKAGSTIPVKWALKDANGNFVSDLGTFVGLTSHLISCNTNEALDDIEQTVASGGSILRYDFTANQFIYNWSTLKSWAPTCRQLVLTLNDGTTHTADFKFK